jgi:pyruvate, water dikinase
MARYIKFFDELTMKDVALVGGKNASLGEMIHQLKELAIKVPQGFAVTSDAYWYFLERNNLQKPMQELLSRVTGNDLEVLQQVGERVRNLIEQATIPEDLAQEIIVAYKELSQRYQQQSIDVAVRSSATAEDLPGASFAGQQETYLNVQGEEAVLEASRKAIASLFTDRAIIYRIHKGFDHFKVAMSLGIQKMVRSDKAISGVAFSLDTETGFRDVVVINATYGLAEMLVQGAIIPDEFYVFKPMLDTHCPIIKKQLGNKEKMMVYGTQDESTRVEDVAEDMQSQFCMSDAQILALARQVCAIENYYSERAGKWTPMDVEWAVDGNDKQLYIIQARPETVHATVERSGTLQRYRLVDGTPNIITTGQSIGQKIVSGIARVVNSVHEIDQIQDGEIIVTRMTDPDWVPVMKRAAGIITASGGRTCHAAIVSREIGLPAIVGAERAVELIESGDEITLDCSKGKDAFIYKGKVPFTVEVVETQKLPQPAVPILVNISDPAQAFALSFLPTSGVGLARIEFIISSEIGIHPMALLRPESLDAATKKIIDEMTASYKDPATYFIDKLAQGIATIAAAFWPRPVTVRFSDFKTDEYRNLIGGTYFEPVEANPMLGLRGASRYYHEQYAPAFALECLAMKKVRDEMGLTNVQLMIPFVRTPVEAKEVLQLMKRNGLERGGNGLQILMMIEIPANVLLMDVYSNYFDGFSIGSNDLTQFTLSVDRNSEILAPMFDERAQPVEKMLELAVCGAKKNNRYISICGQAPSDYPEIAEFLICLGISAISLNEDSVIPFLMKNPQCKDSKESCTVGLEKSVS